MTTAALLAVSGYWPFVFPLLLVTGVLGWELFAGPLRLERAVSEVSSTLDQTRAELVAQRDRFELTFHQAVTPMALVVPPMRARSANRALTELLGRAELSGHDEIDLLGLVHPDDRAAVDELMARPAGSGRRHEALVRWQADDRWCWGRTCLSRPPHDTGPGDLRLLQIHDVTEQKHAQDLLMGQAGVLEMIARRASRRDTLTTIAGLATLHRPTAVACLVLAGEDRTTFEPAVGLDEHPIARQALAGRPVSPEVGPFGPVACHGQPVMSAELATDPLWEGLDAALEDLGAHSGWAVPIAARNGLWGHGVLAFFWPERHVPDESDRRIAAICTHLAGLAIEQHAVDAELERTSLDDELTGLANRALFLDRVTNALTRARRRTTTVGVAVIDLDGFQSVNGEHGKARGDEILSTVAGRLTGAVRPGDTVGRISGDRFGVLCEDIASAGEVHRIAARLGDAVRVPVARESHSPAGPTTDGAMVTASIGLALVDDVVGDTDRERTFALLRAAEGALSVAKAAGGARAVVFDEALRARAVSHRRGEAQLRRALEQGEIWVAYQPAVDLATGVIESVEALARWDHPHSGPVPPLDFLALAEDTGLIVPLGDLVLVESLRALARWDDEAKNRHGVVMAVNFTGSQLESEELAPSVDRALFAAGIAPDRLCCEIPEPVLAALSEGQRASLSALVDIGVQITVDDAGCTPHAVDVLAAFRPARAKLAWPVVERYGADPDGDAAHEARRIVVAAAAAGSTLTAKGVETEHHMRAAIDLGCHAVQGFLLARPEPAEAIAPRLGRKLVSGAAVRRALPAAG
jgi:diguanylate cyclase (GGDEF)-like protein/PAS domain S-box-containing protein